MPVSEDGAQDHQRIENIEEEEDEGLRQMRLGQIQLRNR
jgi:hypothetical protein